MVTATENKNSATTSRIIDKATMEHIQMVNVSDISGLLPGGSTSNPSLLSEQGFGLRGEGSFSTAVEVDGVRLSNNSSFSGISGVTVNNISSTNVESIEVITGLPSVEYGDMGSGIVKINTSKGRTPWQVNFTTNPNLKQVAASKGFGLGSTKKGSSLGVLNFSMERANAISDPRSPYTSYTRNGLTLNYNNNFSRGFFSDKPLRLSVGFSGNLGQRDDKDDPDSFGENRAIYRDDALRGNFSLNWLLSKPWITDITLSGSASYSNKNEWTKTNYSYATPQPIFHGTEKGYFIAQDYEKDPDAAIILSPTGYYYGTLGVKDQPFIYKLSLKGNWVRNFGRLTNKVKVGGEWSGEKNFGSGKYTDDLRTAPSFQEYRFCDVPFMNTLSAYIEESATIAIGKSNLTLIAGLRSDTQSIKNSIYGTTTGLSPRFNVKWDIMDPKEYPNSFFNNLSVRASYGVSTKLPSFSILYPVPMYTTIDSFNSTANSSNTAYYARFILPQTIQYNPDLLWRRNRQSEVGLDFSLGGTQISLSAYYNQTHNEYNINTGYEPFTYAYTNQSALVDCAIPVDDRVYSVDKTTGIVTVADKTGALPSEVLAHNNRTRMSQTKIAMNDASPNTNYGVEWVIDFAKIRSINTSIRVDGSFKGSRSVDTNIQAFSYANETGSDGEPFKYIGFYYGGHTTANGLESRSINNNITVTTHIPKLRLIASVRLETRLLTYSRDLSEGPGGEVRSHLISSSTEITDILDGSIYDVEGTTVTYPLYYTTAADPTTPRNYLEDLARAKENDSALYSDLRRLALPQSEYQYYFMKNRLSPFFTLNFRVTKEIGDLASISFYANNFIRTNGQVYSSKTKTYTPSSAYVGGLYYGLSLKLKF